MVKTELHEGSADERRNASEYQLTNVLCGVLKVALMKTDSDVYNARYVQY